MAASEKVRIFINKYQISEKEKAKHQKLIDAGVIGVTEDRFFSEDYAKEQAERIQEWEDKVEQHGGDRNWAVKEYAVRTNV